MLTEDDEDDVFSSDASLTDDSSSSSSSGRSTGSRMNRTSSSTAAAVAAATRTSRRSNSRPHRPQMLLPLNDRLDDDDQQQQQDDDDEHDDDEQDIVDTMATDTKQQHRPTQQHPTDKQLQMDEDERRRQAYERLAHIETVFRSLKRRIVLHKERSLDDAACSVRSEQHPAYINAILRLDNARASAIRTAKIRHQCLINAAESDAQAARLQINRLFYLRRTQLRQSMLRLFRNTYAQLLEEQHVDTSSRIPAPAHRPETFLKQAKWQRWERLHVLAKYCSKMDENGHFVPPRLYPHGLRDDEAESDLRLLRLYTGRNKDPTPPQPTYPVADSLQDILGINVLVGMLMEKHRASHAVKSTHLPTPTSTAIAGQTSATSASTTTPCDDPTNTIINNNVNMNTNIVHQSNEKIATPSPALVTDTATIDSDLNNNNNASNGATATDPPSKPTSTEKRRILGTAETIYISPDNTLHYFDLTFHVGEPVLVDELIPRSAVSSVSKTSYEATMHVLDGKKCQVRLHNGETKKITMTELRTRRIQISKVGPSGNVIVDETSVPMDQT